jgi:PTS system nitrogen regulatory IIA component
MRLSDYLRDDLILHRMEADGSASALEAFGAVFEEGNRIPPGFDVTKALKAREEAHTTCLGKGVALPHATVPGLPEILLMVAIAKPPIQFGPPEADPVDLFFVLLSPSGRERDHIKLLARICRLAQHPEGLHPIRESKDPAELMDAILALDSKHL